MTKKIGIDCRFASEHAGLGRYTREVVSRLITHHGDAFEYVLFVRSPDEEWLKPLVGAASVVVADIPHYSLKEQILLPSIFRGAEIDLLFSPHFNVPLATSVPFVVVVHDLILHRFPNDASPIKRLAYKTLFAHAIKHARCIIAVSDFTAAELHVAYPRLKTTIAVVPEAADERFRPVEPKDVAAVKNRYGLPDTYLLYIGNAKEHKRVPLLLEAFAAARPEADLVLVSGGRELSSVPLPDRVHVIGGVSDDDLPAVYSGAKAFVTASAYEGFCLPVVEARASGCPVIATDASAIPEAAEGDAMLHDGSFEGLVEALRSVDRLPAPSQPSFRWEKTVSKIADILREAA